ncbi:MAG TPA: DUF1360 domain-containing protein [Micromonosporaceae bacterium]|nr:DUF1360 domain-containing protein [Micromonosporaceae bacterium]
MTHTTARAARAVRSSYARGHQRPLPGYLVTLGTYSTVVGGLTALARARRQPLPERVSAGDVVLVGIATHKISRVLAKDSVTSPLRAPFTRYREPSGESEVNEEVRTDDGPVRHAVGELVSCPFCLAVWVATGLAAGLVFAPRLTRLVATAFTAVTASDFLQLAYEAARRGARDDEPDR